MSNEKRLQQIRDAARYKYPDERIHFIDGAKWADSHPQWIPVEEELPKFDEQVLVYGLCPNGCRLFYVDCLIQDINDNGYPKWDDDTIIPTHWMEIVPPRKEGMMKATCIKADPLQWLEVGKEYECVERYNKVHIVGVGMVVSKETFNEHFESKKE